MTRKVDLLAAALFFLLITSVAGRSQIMDDLLPSNLGGRDSVTGTIYLPDRRPAGRGIVVKLNRGGNDASSWTDPDGKFIFNGVGNGTYTLTVEVGDEFEPATHRFEVTQPRNSPPQTHFVNIQLRWRPDAKPKPAVIDAELARVPKKALEHYRIAQAARAKGDHQGAAAELSKAVAEYPEFGLAHLELGVEYLQLNQLDKADEHLQTAMKLKPGAYDPIANRGIVLTRLKKYQEAEALLREALQIKDDSAVTHLYLGRALIGLNRPDDAIGELRIALLMGGNQMIEARRTLVNLYLQQGENEKALSELELYLAANPRAADAPKLRETVQQIKDLIREKRKQ